MEKQPQPNLVGIFDSGIGGLSVLREIHALLPFQPLYFVADQAHVPYGKRELEEIRAFSFAISEFLITQGARVIVVACNTASAAALKELRDAYPHITFVGMEPAVKPATQSTHNGVVGVLATPATFEGRMYNTLVEKFARDVKVLTNTCAGLVEEIENGGTDSQKARRILQQALIPMVDNGADTIVLGCTHFPFVVPLIEEIVGPHVAVIDPAPAIARRTSYLLDELGLMVRFADEEHITFATTGNAGKFNNNIYSLLGLEAEPVEINWQDGNLVYKQA